MSHNSEIARLQMELHLEERRINDRSGKLEALKIQLWRHRMGRAHMEGQLAAYAHVARLSPAMDSILKAKVAGLKKGIGPI